MRPTPETDELISLREGFGVTNNEWALHSRRLERERNEARELAEKWRKESNWIGNEPSYKFPWEAAK